MARQKNQNSKVNTEKEQNWKTSKSIPFQDFAKSSVTRQCDIDEKQTDTSMEGNKKPRNRPT